jgi:polysaccharide biosynthesis protein PslG
MPVSRLHRWFTVTLVCALSLAYVSIATGALISHSTPKTTQRHIANPFGQDMFGLSTDGQMQNEGPRKLSEDLSDDAAAGAKWLRVAINWAQIQVGGRRSYNWAPIDNIVTRAREDGMQILGVLIYTPRWAEASKSCRQADCAPNAGDFGKFAQMAAAHYGKLGVSDFEIWSEENSVAQWVPKPNPKAYTGILKAAYVGIKQVNPSATVITGGTSPAPTDADNYSPTDFLAALYADGAKPYFDAVAAHPYCWPAYPGQPFTWSAWYQTFGAHRSMRSVMVAHGDGHKLIWGTEFGAATYGPKGAYVSPATQAKMVFDAYKTWGGYSWAGPLILFEGRDQLPNTVRGLVWEHLGLRYSNFKEKPAYAAYQRAVATF